LVGWRRIEGNNSLIANLELGDLLHAISASVRCVMHALQIMPSVGYFVSRPSIAQGTSRPVT
jgi:hypothetical protein